MTYRVGAIEVERVEELHSWRFHPQDMFPDVTSDLYASDLLDFTIATYLVRTPDTVILIDAGNGNDKYRPVLHAHHGFSTDYLDRLKLLVDPMDVDVVVCTHLHPDHCGGLTHRVEGQWLPVFPRARHLVPREELSWLQAIAANNPTEGAEADLARTYQDSVAPVLAAGLIALVDLPLDLGHGVFLRASAGHTAGHLSVEIHNDDDFAVFCGDVLHDPFQLADLSLAHAGDANPDRAHLSRQQLVSQLADTGGTLFPCHFEPGNITRTDRGFQWRPRHENR